MINYPTIQQKVRDELKEICGDSLPSLAHQPRHAFEFLKKNGDRDKRIKLHVLITLYVI